MAHSVQNGRAAAAFPFCYIRNVMSVHDTLEDSPGSASALPHNKVLIREVLNVDAGLLGEGVLCAADYF